MKKITTLSICVGISLAGIAQNVGIGTPTPNASALLELQSTNKGLLLPRVADTSAVASPAKGLVIYSTNANALFYYNGGSWQSTANSGSGDLWYKYQDSLLVTDKKYLSINPNPDVQMPMSGLTVNGNLSVQSKITASNTEPTVAQTFTMNNTASIQTNVNTDSVGRIFDPGGQNVNYFNNMQGNYILQPDFRRLGVSLNFNPADFGLGTGDTLWISSVGFPSCRTDNLLMLTNTNIAPGTLNILDRSPYIIFRSNGDGVNNKGFDISWKGIFIDNTVSNIRAAGFGQSLVFNTDDGSFQAGAPVHNLGKGSACIGCFTSSGLYSFSASGASSLGEYSASLVVGRALGNNSFSVGNGSISIASNSFTMGTGCITNGYLSYAFGNNTEANGYLSYAFGDRAKANGMRSFSLGGYTTTNGDYSTALGLFTTAQSYISLALGRYNDTFPGTSKTTWVNTDPLLYVGNGVSEFNRSNAMVIYKNANVDINGYTRLGKLSEGAPVIKMKKFTGTSSSSQNGFTDITHGLSRAKIIGVQVIMKLPGFVDLGPGSRVNSGYEYEFQILDSIIRIANLNGNSANILSKNFVVLVTYEE